MFCIDSELIQAHKEWYEKQKREEVTRLLLELIMIGKEKEE